MWDYKYGCVWYTCRCRTRHQDFFAFFFSVSVYLYTVNVNLEVYPKRNQYTGPVDVGF